MRKYIFWFFLWPSIVMGDGLPSNHQIDVELARETVLAGVHQIHGGLSPGYMVAFGTDAYEIALEGDALDQGPLVAAAAWGAGRVLAVPDHQMLNMHLYGNFLDDDEGNDTETPEWADSARFYKNGIEWLSGDEVNVHVVTLSAEVGAWLTSQRYSVSVTDVDGLADALSGDADVFVPPWLGPNVTDETLEIIANFVREGGGLFIAEYGVGYRWWWNLPISEAPGNRLLREAGIGFLNGARSKPELVTLIPADGQYTAADAQAVLEQGDRGEVLAWGQAMDMVEHLRIALRPNDPLLVSLYDVVEGRASGHGFSVNDPVDPEGARDIILDGVNRIHGGVSPGFMVAFGHDAYAIAVQDSDPSAGPLVAAASWGAGRVVAVPDHQMLNMHDYGNTNGADAARFYRNGIRWLTRENADPKILTLSAEMGAWLEGQGYQVTVTNLAGLGSALEGEHDLLVPPWLGPTVGQPTLNAIADFVRGGGALFIAEYGVGYEWWWGKPIHQAPANLLLREAGIAFGNGSRQEPDLVNLRRVDGTLSIDGMIDVLETQAAFDTATRDRVGSALDTLQSALPPDDMVLARLDETIGVAIRTVCPTPATPTSSKLHKMLLKREVAALRRLSPSDIEAHRCADALFGLVPDDAESVSRSVMIAPVFTRWHATGLYAAPGQLVTVEVPAEAIDLGLTIRFGGHTDDISPRSEWKRPHQVHWAWPLDSEIVQAASPYGGALYIDVGTDNCDVLPFELTIHGAVEAPYFVLGETSNEDWIETSRHAPGPYAELVSEHVSISLPSNMVRELRNPHEVMTFWNDVVRYQDQLGTHEALRYMAERINIDVQISGGLLHAGYPTQGALGSGPELVDLEALLNTGSWGWFHELGHEAQRRPDKTWPWNNVYTFDDSVEATVNIFTVYAYDGMGIREQGGWRWTGDAVSVMNKALDGTERGDYADIGVDYKLAMFLQLRDHFGWAPFLDVFRSYNQETGPLPRTDGEKRDDFAIRFSAAVGHNLMPFFRQVWGLQISDDVALQASGLPQWMPALGGIANPVSTASEQALDIDLAGEALSHDGVADVVDVQPPAHGTIVVVNGRHRYTPNSGFTGWDSFEYGVRSSTGHVQKQTVHIRVSSFGVVREIWRNIDGNDISTMTDLASYPDEPNERSIVETLEIAQGFGDAYGARLQAFLIPPESGDYTFWIASDDNGEFYIAPSDDPLELVLVASVPAWTNWRDWRRFPEQQSEPIPLDEGQVYAVEARVKEGYGGDHLSIAWAIDGAQPTPIPRDHLFIEPPNAESLEESPAMLSAVGFALEEHEPTPGPCGLFICPALFGNCDGALSNGCEQRLDTNEHCGECGISCAFANGDAVCEGGVCALVSCLDTFGDCDGDAENGCEEALDQIQNCGACGVLCTRANATTHCPQGQCSLESCVAGFGNCDGDTFTGCETDLSTASEHCGGCGRPCEADSVCLAGACIPSENGVGVGGNETESMAGEQASAGGISMGGATTFAGSDGGGADQSGDDGRGGQNRSDENEVGRAGHDDGTLDMGGDLTGAGQVSDDRIFEPVGGRPAPGGRNLPRAGQSDSEQRPASVAGHSAQPEADSAVGGDPQRTVSHEDDVGGVTTEQREIETETAGAESISTSAVDIGSGSNTEDATGCSCRSATTTGVEPGWLLLLFGLRLRRSRRCRRFAR